MNRTAIAIIAFIIVSAAILGGAYIGFFTLATHFPPGRTLGLLSSAMMIGSGLACAGAGYLANKWVQKGTADDKDR